MNLDPLAFNTIYSHAVKKSEGLHISISISFLLKVFPDLPIPLSLFTTSVAVAVLFMPDWSIIELNGIRPVRKKKERSIGAK